MTFVPKLNSIRTIAVVLVIISHYFRRTDFLNFGETGVDIFFFLSGFLITSLLVRDHKRIEAGQLSIPAALKNFYVRRALRIFPLYYAVIIALYALGPKTGTGIRQNFAYFFFYLPNHYFFNRGDWDGILSHFWSLGVEEQYYLVWPFIFFFARDRRVPTILMAMIAISLGFRGYMKLTTGNNFYDILTLSCIHKFAAGALLTYFMEPLRRNFTGNQRLHDTLFLLTFPVYAALCVFDVPMAWLLRDLVVFYFFFYSLMTALHRNDGLFHRVLANSWMVYLGLISYGLYVFHLITPWLVTNALGKLGLLRITEQEYLFAGICFLVTVAMSHLSYFLYEKKFLDMKRHFA